MSRTSSSAPSFEIYPCSGQRPINCGVAGNGWGWSVEELSSDGVVGWWTQGQHVPRPRSYSTTQRLHHSTTQLLLQCCDLLRRGVRDRRALELGIVRELR